jgi:hypothetical protein
VVPPVKITIKRAPKTENKSEVLDSTIHSNDADPPHCAEDVLAPSVVIKEGDSLIGEADASDDEGEYWTLISQRYLPSRILRIRVPKDAVVNPVFRFGAMA